MGQPPVPPAAQPHQPQQAAIQAQLADVQALSADHQHARAGTQHDALVVESLYVLHAGDGELLPSLQL